MGAFISEESGELNRPWHMVFGPNGDLYVHDGTADQVLRFQGPNVTVLNNSEVPLSDTYRLYQNYPNPFNHQTAITFDLPAASPIQISIYNLYGQHIDVLVDRTFRAGRHEIIWKPGGLSSGVYYYQIESTQFTATRKMTYVK